MSHAVEVGGHAIERRRGYAVESVRACGRATVARVRACGREEGREREGDREEGARGHAVERTRACESVLVHHVMGPYISPSPTNPMCHRARAAPDTNLACQASQTHQVSPDLNLALLVHISFVVQQ